jgi:hypothetical protein
LAAALLLSIGVGAVLLLAAGAADPPHAGPLRWQAASPEGWDEDAAAPGLSFLEAPFVPPDLPFTVEIGAYAGASGAIWGIWLGAADTVWHALIHTDGSLSLSSDDRPHWFEFMHILPTAPNRLYLHLDSDGSAALRINDELAWTGMLPAPERWGVVCADCAAVTWETMRLYSR